MQKSLRLPARFFHSKVDETVTENPQIFAQAVKRQKMPGSAHTDTSIYLDEFAGFIGDETPPWCRQMPEGGEAKTPLEARGGRGARPKEAALRVRPAP